MAALTFGQAKTLFAPFITSQGPTDDVVASAINFVNERFISSGQWRGNRFIKPFTPFQGEDDNYYVDTDLGVESIIKILAVDTDSNGDIMDIMDDWYPWDQGGIGFMPPTYVGDSQVIRQGLITEESKIVVAGAGTTEANGDYFQTNYDFSVDGVKYQKGNFFFQLYLRAIETEGPVNQQQWLITNGLGLYTTPEIPYTGSESVPMPYDCTWDIFGEAPGLPPVPSVTFVGPSEKQRYRIVGCVPETRTMYCLVRRAYVPLVNDYDLLIPSNRNAYRYGVQAYNYENVNELERAQVYWQLAYQSLNDETMAFQDGAESQVDVQMKAFATGEIQNLI